VKRLAIQTIAGLFGFLSVPWYGIEDGFFSREWIAFYPMDPESAPAPLQILLFGRLWLVPYLIFLLVPAARRTSRALLIAGIGGLAWSALQGLSIGALGWSFETLELLFGPLANKQYGMGYGALIVNVVFVLYLAEGLAARGFVRGDAFVVAALALVIGSNAVFVGYPTLVVLLRAFEAEDGGLSVSVFVGNLFSFNVLRVALNTLVLAVLASAGSTALGLCFALVVTRTKFFASRVLRSLTVLPIITPPFVLGLAVILMFGRAGVFTQLISSAFGVEPSRYIFGLPGVLLAQLLAFTPIAFLVLIGVVEGISPSMEEAAQTLGADRWKTFVTVSLPLMRPGIANAFLLGFIESLADFGNPLVLGGNFDVLATDIYFAVAGAQNDVPRASALALVLLAFTLFAFFVQRSWLGDRSYTTMTGKADSGAPCPLPRSLSILVKSVAIPWALFTGLIYALALLGGFVRIWGRDHTFTLEHFSGMFAVSSDLQLVGSAWPSLLTTIGIATISAPLTAALGLLTAYLLARQRFRGRSAFEFGTMLSFAIPGTVIGVSYILAFNVPPIEVTGTGAILVICFVFRNMTVGIRAGMATLSQIDASLDEASLTLGASSFTTLRKVVLPLLRPAIVAALVYGFVRAMTAVSAVIFLVSANFDLATVYILGRVEHGDYGPAIAYSAALIVLMTLAIGSIELMVGRRNIGRRMLA
jgi:iron(III) transport system permease protein